jgi:DNA-binding HxlR family transcriptional regulator
MGQAGSLALSTFGRVLNARILRAHAGESLNTSELEQRLGWAAKASLRVATTKLCELGALERSDDSVGSASTRLTAAGHNLLIVADVIERWLSRSEFGAFDLPDPASRGTIRALVAGWDSTMVQMLADRPRSLAGLSAEIAEHSYPALKRRFARLRRASLMAAVDDGSTTFGIRNRHSLQAAGRLQ